MYSNQFRISTSDIKILSIISIGFIFMAYTPDLFAEGFDVACQRVGTFVDNIVRILGFISIGVVTIAIIFAGYQIAFAHKRFTDVAPVLIGGLLIGGAGQIAGWFLEGTEAYGTC